MTVTDKEGIRPPSRALIKSLITAGADAGRQALETGQRQLGGSAESYAQRSRRANPDGSVDELVDRVIGAHIRLARTEGAAAGLATTGTEIGTVVETAGIGTLPAIALVTLTDLTMLAWIQLRMTMIIAALHGHDPLDPARLREFLALQGATPAAFAPGVAEAAAEGASRVGKRLLMRYLRGPALASTKSLFRAVGIKFSREAVIRQLPFVNVPINAAVNDLATRRLAQKANAYYRTLPSAEPAAA